MAGANPDVLRKRPKAASALQTEDETYTTDVVVVGGGGAGLSAAASVLQANKDVILVEKFPAIGGNTVRTGGPMNAADPKWQNGFSALPGERSALEEVLTIDEQEIDTEYLPDFKALKAQITAYLSETTPEKEYLFDSALASNSNLFRRKTQRFEWSTDLWEIRASEDLDGSSIGLSEMARRNRRRI